MTVEQELRELADHELDVMRGRLEELAELWETQAAYWPDLLVPVAIMASRARQLRNVLAGRDAEDDGR